MWSQPLLAQSARRPSRYASGTAGASLGDGNTALALAAAIGYDLAGPFSVEGQLAYARKLDFALDLCPAPLVCVTGGEVPVTGRTVALLAHIAAELPGWRALRPYVVAGGGAAHVRQRYVVPPDITRGVDSLVPADRVERTRSKLAPALSLGGGADVPLSSRLAIGLDVRVLSIFDDEPTPERFIVPGGILTAVRIGSRLSWRF